MNAPDFPDPTGPEPGEGSGAAHDGEPRENVHPFPGTGSAADDGEPRAGDDGQSIAARAAAGESPDDQKTEQELFPSGSLDGDPNLSIPKLLAGKPLTLEVKMKGGSTGLKGGILDPRQVGRAMVVHEVEKIELIPQREGEPGSRKIVGWTVRQILRPTHTEDLDKALNDPATGLRSA